MTIKRYLTDNAICGEVVILELIDSEKKIVRVAETWFHPQGGGQKADTGSIGPAAVTHVAHSGPGVDHFVDSLDGLQVGGIYPFAINGQARSMNAAYHTAGHLIAGVVENYGNYKALSGHQWPGEARVEFDRVPEDIDAFREKLQLDLLLLAQERLAVKVIGDPYTDRAIKIGEYCPIPCGGTHVMNISEIGRISLDSVRVKSGKLRVSYSVTL